MALDLPVKVLLRLVAVLLAVAVGIFLLLQASPVDPVAAYLGPAAQSASPERVAEIARIWGQDQPLGAQVLALLSRLVQGDLGFSHSQGASVVQVLAERVGPSLTLAGGAWGLSGVLGLALGAVAGMRAGSLWDRVICLWCLITAASPGFWLAMVMISVFSVALGWTPVCCAAPLGLLPHEVSWSARLHHLILPLATLTLLNLSQVALHARLKVAEAMASDPAQFARAQGAGEWDVLCRHALRPALLPVVAVTFAGLGEVMGGAILAEQVFGWPGLGQAGITAAMTGDVALLLAISLVTATVVASANLLADQVALRLDPRLKRAL